MTVALTRVLVALKSIGSRRENGATAVEYGLLVALIAAVIVAVVAVLGTRVSSTFDSVSNAI